MSEDDVKKFLRYHSTALVDFGLTLVNLTWQERLAVTLCGRQRYTQEQAAEQAGYSVDAMQKWYRAGMSKLVAEWAAHDWILKVIN